VAARKPKWRGANVTKSTGERESLIQSDLEAHPASAQPRQRQPLGRDICVAYTCSATEDLGNQHVDCMFIAARIGKPVIKVYSDLRLSGTSISSRGQFAMLMADARRGQFNHLVIANVDRIARDFVLAMGVIQQFLGCGVSVHTTNGMDVVSIRAGDAGSQERELRELAMLGMATAMNVRRRRRALKTPTVNESGEEP
jgi:hypothetical protein